MLCSIFNRELYILVERYRSISMGDIIKVLEHETGKACFDTYRRCLDYERASLIEYDEFKFSCFFELLPRIERSS